MKKSLVALAALTAALSCAAQVSLQNFSSTLGANTYFYGSWEAAGNDAGSTTPNAQFSQGVGVYNITGTGVTNSSNSKIEFFYSTPASIGAFDSLLITAKLLAGNAATSFQVKLFDTGAKSATASFTTASYTTSSYESVIAALNFDGGFDPDAIDSMVITGAIPSGTQAFAISFDQVSATAVPEPSAYAALAGLAILGVVVFRRRSARRDHTV